jgi:hypothetical protein
MCQTLVSIGVARSILPEITPTSHHHQLLWEHIRIAG